MKDNSTIPTELSNYKAAELAAEAKRIRARIISTVQSNGGHLSSNLGAVELTLALLKVFNPEKDRILFDVGHQCYTYKLLTGRDGLFDTLRQKGGISGFQNSTESVCDPFTTGHAGNSVALSVGFCKARDAVCDDYYVVDVVGDGALANGMALEALVSDVKKPDKLLIVLNDNGMAISKNSSALYAAISKMTARSGYLKFKSLLKRFARAKWLYRLLSGLKEFVKRVLNRNNMFDEWGFKYVGPVDGHNIEEMVAILESIKETERPTLLHVITKKGCGVAEAESDAAKYHGVGRHLKTGTNTFSDAISDIMVKLKEKDDRIQAVTAAMCDGVGLKGFAEKYPDSYTDVGIAEAYAVTMSAAMAKAGQRPFVFIYSTFLQRAYDQIIEEVALEKLPVVLMLDRAGLTGYDGVTHQGIFDLAYLSHVPGLSIYSPKDVVELEMLTQHAAGCGTPVAIRYENGDNPSFATHSDLKDGLWETVATGKSACILAVGGRMLRLALNVAETLGREVTVVNCRTVKPLDEPILNSVAGLKIITLEDGVVTGGFGERVVAYYSAQKIKADVTVFGVPDRFVEHASVAEQMLDCGLTVEKIVQAIKG